MQSFNDVWNMVLEEMKAEFSETAMRLWFNDLELVLLNDRVAVLVSKSDFKRDMIEKRHLKTIEKYMGQILGFDVNIYILSTENAPLDLSVFEKDDTLPEKFSEAAVKENIKPEETKNPAQTETDESDDELSKNASAPLKHISSLKINSGSAVAASNSPETREPDFYSTNDKNEPKNYASVPYNNNYTFDNFIVGNSNKFAHAACVSISHNPARDYNPLFIYGPSGLGKTHLLYAIINEISARDPSKNIIYVKGEEFTNQMIDSIAKNYTEKFRAKYRNVDVLLIDDIQFIAGRESTQEEFFHTFNALYEEYKQIIMTSDRPPRDIKLLEDRLRTRFEWGLIADIQPPDLELRIAIMKNKAKMTGVTIPNDVLNFLAENLKSNVRQIEGAVKKISAQSFLTGSPITIEFVTSCVSDLLSVTEPVKVTIDKIFDTIQKKYGIPAEEIKGRKRTKEISTARHVTVYMIRTITEMSLPAIGKLLNRDHTTVLASIDTVKNEIKNNSVFEMEINDLIKEIKG